jgi:hypothetical protein
MFFKKKSLFEYFLYNKLTFPIKKIKEKSFLFSHSNENELEKINNEYKEMVVKSVPHKLYDFIFLISLKSNPDEVVVVVDEAYIKDDLHLFNVLSDILKNDNWGLNTIISKEDNVINVNFKR